MYDNNRGGRSDRRNSDRQMHDATCAKCGTNCKVPFAPTSGKPVYCSDCFDSQSGGNRRNDFSKKRFDRPNRPAPVDYGPRLEQISNKLDKILEMLVIQNMENKAPSENQEPVETDEE